MPTALITGASSGLGEQFAYVLAQERYALVLTARRKDRLGSVAEKARELGAPRAAVMPADLTQSGAPASLHRRIKAEGIKVDYLVNNAGFGTRGGFASLALDRELEEVELNVKAVVALARLFLPAMVRAGTGTIINVASTAGFQPVPYMATYSATKAFVLSFSQALSAELAGTGVTVMALCPGPTRTEFQAVAGTADAPLPSFSYMEAAPVAAEAVRAARRGKRLHVSGAMNTLLAGAARFAPRGLVIRVAGGVFRQR